MKQPPGHEGVRAILVSDLTEFKTSCAGGTITGLACTELSPSQIPSWLDQYIESIGENLSLFDPTGPSIAMARHVKDKANQSTFSFWASGRWGFPSHNG